jgi:hypothetical protein
MEPAEKSSRLATLARNFARPVSAPVVDLFRILAGLLICVYYVRIFREYSLYTAENGLLDHVLHREIFWFTKLSLFYPGSPSLYKLLLLSVGFSGAVMLTLGIRPKVGAAICWIVAVSVHRWNFAVINLDDSSITLLLWWMLFMPIGHTLTWETWRGRSDRRAEAFLKVDGFFVRAYFVNLFIYYFTAGFTKLTSELWREGLALYVVLNLPLARTHGMWSPEQIPLTWLGNHFTLIMEPLFPFLVFLRKGHPIKYLGGLTWIGFHLAIPITIGVPYANLGLILALVLVFHEELEDLFKRRAQVHGPSQVIDWQAPRGTKALIVSYLIVLFLAMQKNVPILKAVWEPAMATLYLGGVAQEYHLFDWIDRYNWTIEHQIMVRPDGGAEFEVPSTSLFPHSVRGFIVQSYLLPMRWMRVPRPLTGEMRNSMLEMAAKHFVRTQADKLGSRGQVIVNSRMGQLDKDNLTGDRSWETQLMRLRYDRGNCVVEYPRPPAKELQ